jgi:hypothetical protein
MGGPSLRALRYPPQRAAQQHKDTRGFKGCVGAFSESGFFSEPIFAFLLFLHFSHAFLPPPNHSSPFFLRTCPARPNPHTRAHTCPGITPATVDWCQSVRLAGRKRHARFERALRLWQSCRQWRPQPWSCMDAAPRVSLAPGLHVAAERRSSANILTAGRGQGG